MRATLLTAMLLTAACTEDVTLAPSRPYIPQPASTQPPGAGTPAQQEAASLDRALAGPRYSPGVAAGRGASGASYDPDDVGAMGTLPVQQAPPGFGGL